MNVDCWLSGEYVSETRTNTASSTSKRRSARLPATALTAAILYQYGTGPVRGFAVTLLAGIAASMITSIFVVRTFYMIWLSRARDAQTLSI